MRAIALGGVPQAPAPATTRWCKASATVQAGEVHTLELDSVQVQALVHNCGKGAKIIRLTVEDLPDKPVPPWEGPPAYGLVDVCRHTDHKRATGEHLYVFLNGTNVTQRCTAADDVAQWADLLPDKPWPGITHVTTVRHYGHVVIRPRTAAELL